jgi:hypothetical protein
MAVLFMNGFAKTDLFFTEQGSFTFNFLKYGQR